MRAIRNKDTKPELRLRKALHANGFRFRLCVKELPGRPDIVLPKYHAVIFVHGCFWHGHNCQYFKWPSTRPEFWREKIGRNRSNDLKAKKALLASGWRVGIVWECSVRDSVNSIDSVTQRLADWLRSNVEFIEERK
jgi:DNA mismatch endonuclease (patch repair protein)